MAYAFKVRAGLAALAGLTVVLPHVVTAETHRSFSRGERLMIPLGTEGPSNPILPAVREVERQIEGARETLAPRRLDTVGRGVGFARSPADQTVPQFSRPADALPAREPEATGLPWPRTLSRVPQDQPIVLASFDRTPARRAIGAGLPWAAAPAVPPPLSTPVAPERERPVAHLQVPTLPPRKLSTKGGQLRMPLAAQRYRLSTRVAFATSKPCVPEPRVASRSTDPIGNPFEAMGARPVVAGPAFIMPFENGHVSSLFNQGRRHPAIDLAGRHGSPVYATSHGQTVIFAGGRGGYGNAVITRDREGREHLYGHLSAINTRVGVTLAQGDRLGALGSTGYSTGPHVHYEVKDRRGAHINPVTLLFPRGVSAGYAWAGTGLVRGASQQAALPEQPTPSALPAPPTKVAKAEVLPPALVRAQVGGQLNRTNRVRTPRYRAVQDEE